MKTTHSIANCMITFTVICFLNGCSTIERQPEHAVSEETAPQATAPQATAPQATAPQAEATPAETSSDSKHDAQVTTDNSEAPVAVESIEKDQPAPNVSLNLLLFGLSYHPDRKGTRQNHVDNEFNGGLGASYVFHESDLGVASVEAGFYWDSGRNWAKFAGPGYHFKLGNKWKIGADLLVIQSETYNQGQTFVAPIPLLTYDFDHVKLNALYIPKIANVNLYSAFGFYLTIPLQKW